jgi:hypothetical protein
MDPTVIMLGVSAVIFLLSRSKSKGSSGTLPPPPPPDDEVEPDPTPGGGDRPGDAPSPGGRIPKTRPGGKRFGDVEKNYPIPAGWDPVRGIYFSPDCEVVVEAPAWFCGLDGNGAIQLYPGSPGCRAVEASSYKETMAIPRNGVAGFVDYLITKDFDPSQIAWTILDEAAPNCWNLDQKDWPPGLVHWWNYLLRRVSQWYEESTGIPYDPFANT